MPAILEVAGLRKAFGGIVALDNVNLTIAQPGIYGLIGPNGAGKTTLFDVICGRQEADSGSIRFEGQSIEKLRVHRRARLGFSRTFQECRVLAEESCLDNVLFAAQDKRLGSELVQGATRNTRGRSGALAEARRLPSGRMRATKAARCTSLPAPKSWSGSICGNSTDVA